MKHNRNEKLINGIAEVFKQIREKNGFSQEKVMNDLKIDEDLSIHLGRIETAKNNPSISTISILCKYYKISLSDFFLQVENKIK